MKKCLYTKSLLFLVAGLMACCVLQAQQTNQNNGNTTQPQASPKQSTNLFFGLLVFNIWNTPPKEAQQANSGNNTVKRREVSPSAHNAIRRSSSSTHKSVARKSTKAGRSSSQHKKSVAKKSKKNTQTDLFAKANGNEQPTNNNGGRRAGDEPQETYTYPSNSTPTSNPSPIPTQPSNPTPPPTPVASIDQYLHVEKKSLRRDNILEDETTGDNNIVTATPLPYTPIFSADALYRVRVWRLLNTKESPNTAYFYAPSIDENSDTRFINIIINAMRNDSLQAFSAVDDRFTTPLSFDQALQALGGASIDSIYKYQIKEDWVFNNRDGKTYVRILGIAPLITTATNTEVPAFWIYYPDLRQNLVRNTIPNPSTGGLLTWEAIFENRLFTSRILHSTLDAQNGFANTPLTNDQSDATQNELNNLGRQANRQQATANN
jgi:hypothetical protein